MDQTRLAGHPETYPPKNDKLWSGKWPGSLRQGAMPLERLLALDKLNAVYEALLADCGCGGVFTKILRLLNKRYLLTADALSNIPHQGALLVVANHPFGGIEGIILGDLLQRVRPETKLLGNSLLNAVEPIRDSLIPVDPFDTKSSVPANARAFRACLQWLRKGNCLVAFPSGEVAHFCFRSRCVTDPPWHRHLAALARMSGATVLPVFFPGRNSLFFNLVGLVHPRLRTAMLARELLCEKRDCFSVMIGKPIRPKQIAAFRKDETLIQWLRFKTYLLGDNRPNLTMTGRDDHDGVRESATPPFEPIIPEVSRRTLADEVAALPAFQRLVTQKQMMVFVADSVQIPFLLRELGRLREKTFREVGEGTGKSMDVDLYDRIYRHLVLWNAETAEVVGAYRMGDTRAILDRFGRKGLYAHSLFHLKAGMLRHLGNALELGRSFIRSEYQRHPTCLALLWKGIGAYLVRHPRFNLLFGPVSISNHYHQISKQLMVHFLTRHCSSREWVPYVKPRCPVRNRFHPLLREAAERLCPDAIEDVSLLVAEIEEDGKRVPILIKHYLKLNGKFVAFNRDHAFSDAIDGLVVVDLMQVEPTLLKRFMGTPGLEAYQRHWHAERAYRGLATGFAPPR